MVRTELPRATIEEWLDAMQRDVKFPKPPASAAGGADDDDAVDEAGSSGGGGKSIADRAKALRNELTGDALKARIGLGGGDGASKTPKRRIKQGAVLGLAMPPAGLIYSAPWKMSAVGTAAYAAAAYVSLMIPMIGIPYILIPLHVAGGVLGAGYAWRFNRKGKRAPLLPGGEKDEKKR